jgi:lysophospholipase L1-like esterase
MKKQVRWILHLAAFAAALLVLLPGTRAATPRILVVGDSWSALMTHPMAGNLFQQVLDEQGFKDCGVYAPETTAIPGSRADQWASNHKRKTDTVGKLDNLKQELETHPTIDVVFVVIGGNDFLGFSAKNNLMQLGAEGRGAQWTAIRRNIETLVDFILAVRPTMQVVLCDYDYLIIDKAKQANPKMDFLGITQAEFNRSLLELGREKLALVRARPRCHYVNNWGLLQHKLGDPERAVAAGVLPAPGGPPDFEPYAGGDSAQPGPIKGFDLGFGADGIHLNAEGYKLVLRNAVAQAVGPLLRQPEPAK